MLMPALKWAASDDLRRVCLQVWVTVPRGQALSSSCSHQLPALGVGPLLFCSCALLRGDFGEDSRKQRCPQPASRWALGAGHRCASRFFQITSGFAGTLRYPESARTLERGPTQAPPTPTQQPSQNALSQRPDVPGFLAVPQAGRRCLLSVGFTPGRGGPTSPQALSRVTGEVKDRLLRSSTRTLRMPEEAAAWSSCPAYRQSPSLAAHGNNGKSQQRATGQAEEADHTDRTTHSSQSTR
ncbi:uncharacterized protein [Bos indicus]|uniref:Uncharacterized protein n=1 Tax=Bos indicus TaxID=9915 RepID=A0ABM4T9X8_BOSIN